MAVKKMKASRKIRINISPSQINPKKLKTTCMAWKGKLNITGLPITTVTK